ncbi:MAG: hypothetical protein BWY22_02319 [Bacteroidetes bacterium ADurb.Bin217]|nr:MAG: hypothetical protein BWY22_02319 [Bacteroidetes bacterium ADurb.Bin217]
MEIKVLGTGCAKCKSLEQVTKDVVTELHIDATVTKVDDIVTIMGYNVLSTPALVVDEKVIIQGRIPSKQELQGLLQ